jgi:glyoxylase-like metal-dependent hydrolase (beta-lactamase superfamily II)
MGSAGAILELRGTSPTGTCGQEEESRSRRSVRIYGNLALVGSGQYGLSSPFDCSVWAIRAPDGIVLIEAGSGAATDRILSNIEADFGAQRIVAAVTTHSHADHARGLASLRSRTGCSVYAPHCSRAVIENGDEEGSGLRVARQMGIYPPDFHGVPCAVDVTLSDGAELEIAGLRILPLQVRGHSQDHFCLLCSAGREQWLFSGDCVFYGGVLGLINADGSDMAGYRSDFHKLTDLHVDGLFPGHGMFTLSDGQKHINAAAGTLQKGSLGRQIGQWDLIF